MKSLFKPTKSNSGVVLGFSLNSKDGKLFLKFQRQTGPQSFTGGATFNVSLNEFEIGSFIDAMERNVPIKSLIHKTEKGITTINWGPYINKQTNEQMGFSLNVKPKDSDGFFGIGLSFGEMRTFKEYLQFCLGKMFSAKYAADKRSFEDKQKLNQSKPTAPAEEPEQAVEAPESDADFEF